MTSQTAEQVNEPKVGQRCRVCYGHDFYRSGDVVSIDRQKRQALVEFHYSNLGSEWVSWSKLC